MEYINNFETFVNESASNDYLKAVRKCAETGFYYSNSDTGEKCGVSYENRWNLWNPNDCDENTFEKFIKKCKFKYQTNKEFIDKNISEDTIRPEDNEPPYHNPYFMGVGIEPEIRK